jgi:hypothetical protein
MKVEEFAEGIKQVIINTSRAWGIEEYPIQPNKGYMLSMPLVHKGDHINIGMPILEEIKPQEND